MRGEPPWWTGRGRKEGRRETEALALFSSSLWVGAPGYLSGAEGTAPPPLLVQPLKQRFGFLEAVEPHQSQQGVTGSLQGEQVVPAVRPVVARWWTDRGTVSWYALGKEIRGNVLGHFQETLDVIGRILSLPHMTHTNRIPF